MKTANASFENRHVHALFSLHTETVLYQKSPFRAIGEFFCSYFTDFPNHLKYHGQDVLLGISGLEITPTFGLMLPVVIEQKFGTLKMGAEVQVPVVIGNANSIYYPGGSALVINPGLMIIENYYFPQTMPQAIQNLSAKVGVGFSVPISIVTTETFSETGVGFKLNFLLGLQYDFTKHISANIDWNLGTFGVLSSSIRAGVSWKF